MSQTTLAIPKPQNSFKQVKPKTIVGKGENHYVQQEQQQAQHPRGQGRYEQVQDGSRQRGRCTQHILRLLYRRIKAHYLLQQETAGRQCLANDVRPFLLLLMTAVSASAAEVTFSDVSADPLWLKSIQYGMCLAPFLRCLNGRTRGRPYGKPVISDASFSRLKQFNDSCDILISSGFYLFPVGACAEETSAFLLSSSRCFSSADCRARMAFTLS